MCNNDRQRRERIVDQVVLLQMVLDMSAVAHGPQRCNRIDEKLALAGHAETFDSLHIRHHVNAH